MGCHVTPTILFPDLSNCPPLFDSYIVHWYLVLSYFLWPQCGRTACICSQCACRCNSNVVLLILDTRRLLPRLIRFLLPLLLLLLLLPPSLRRQTRATMSTRTTTKSTATATAAADETATMTTTTTTTTTTTRRPTLDHACYRSFGKSGSRWLFPHTKIWSSYVHRS